MMLILLLSDHERKNTIKFWHDSEALAQPHNYNRKKQHKTMQAPICFSVIEKAMNPSGCAGQVLLVHFTPHSVAGTNSISSDPSASRWHPTHARSARTLPFADMPTPPAYGCRLQLPTRSHHVAFHMHGVGALTCPCSSTPTARRLLGASLAAVFDRT